MCANVWDKSDFQEDVFTIPIPVVVKRIFRWSTSGKTSLLDVRVEIRFVLIYCNLCW